MARTVARSDVLLTVMGAPHESELFTSVLRLTQALLERGATVQVWACGHATLLTQQQLGENKPRNLADWDTGYPTSVRLVRDLLEAFPGRLSWYGCRACSEDRGAVAHIPEVRVRSAGRYGETAAAAGKTIYLGVQ